MINNRLTFTGTFFSILFFVSCHSGNNNGDNAQQDAIEIVQSPISSTDPAFILRTNCYLCHNPKVDSHDNILGPPLVASKFRYMKEYPVKDDFVKGMASFLMKPEKEKALMKNPVKKFGVMPVTVLSENQIQAVASYIYDNAIDEPDWFADHYMEEHGESWLGQNAFDKMTLKLNE